MTGINNQTTENTNRTEHHLPNFFWAAAILAGLNLLLLIWFTVSPKLSISAMGEPREAGAGFVAKPSPFTPVVDESAYVKRAAAKARPAEIVAVSAMEPSDLAEPVEPPVGADVLKTVYEHAPSNPVERPVNTAVRTSMPVAARHDETELDIPRMTAVHIPQRTERAADELLAR